MPNSNPKTASKTQPQSNRRIKVRTSGVHGKGVFATADIAEGQTIIEYKGQHITWAQAVERHPHDPSQPEHTFFFSLQDGSVIDGGVNGNSARWFNHSCNPNCYADEKNNRVFICALRNIQAGEELNYDYGLVVDARYTQSLLALYPCWCRAPNCRGTLLAPKKRTKKQ